MPCKNFIYSFLMSYGLLIKSPEREKNIVEIGWKYLNQEKFLHQPDADLQIMFTEAADSPPKALNVKEEACQTQKNKQKF